MKLLLIVIIICVVLALWCFLENRSILVHRYKVRDDKIGAAFDGARILYLVDLHNTSYGKYNRRLKRRIAKLQPDYVLIGGDFLSRPDRTFDAAIDLLAYVSRLCPTIFVNGNHETRMQTHPQMYHNVYQDFMKMAKGLPVTFLCNQSTALKRGKDRIVIDGLELDEAYFKRRCKETLSTGDMTRLLRTCSDADYHILLAHSPNYFPTYAKWGADLTLSGHNHGGMARIPGICGVLSTQAELFPKYTKGLYKESGRQMIVSAGMGSHTIKVRFFNPPEIVMVTLESGRS